MKNLARAIVKSEFGKVKKGRCSGKRNRIAIKTCTMSQESVKAICLASKMDARLFRYLAKI